MKKILSRKALSVSITLALAATAFGGVCLLSDGTSATEQYLNDYLSGNTVTANAEMQSNPSAKPYYVSPDASADDENADGSEEHPYNINYLFDYELSGIILKGGDTVMVLPGTYKLTERIYTTVSGEYNNYIIVKNASTTEKAVLSFYDMAFASTNRGVSINGNYWYWYGVDICGAGDNGMYIAGDYNVIENCEFYNNRDTGLQLGRTESSYTDITSWPNYNLIKNCSSYNNYDNETYGENADGFAAKLTVGYGNIFDGCIAYRNSDDGWDLYAKSDTGNIGAVIIYNCVAFENGYLMETQATCNSRFPTFDSANCAETKPNSYTTRDGDGNGFKLGGSVMEGEVIMYNCMSFNNRMHGVTDNSNPGTLVIQNVTAYNNGAAINNDSTSSNFGQIDYSQSTDSCNNIDVARQTYSYNVLKNILSVKNGNSNTGADVYRGSVQNAMFDNGYQVTDAIDADTSDSSKMGTPYTQAAASDIFTATPALNLGVNNGTYSDETETYSAPICNTMRNSDGSINMGDVLKITDETVAAAGVGCDLTKTSYEAYTHYDYTYLTDDSITSSDQAKAVAIKNMLYIPINLDACYQDFQLVYTMLSVDITWTSSNTDVISIDSSNEAKDISLSNSVMIPAIVYRQSVDTQVTLTASVTVGSVTLTKDFVITVKAAAPEVGTIIAEGVNDDQIIIDGYKLLSEPDITVEDGSDYNGKLLSEDTYTISTKYYYAEDKNSGYKQVAGFTTSVSGVYKIVKTVTLKEDTTETADYTYYIYVASQSADVDFTDGESTLTVNKEGYLIEGEPTNITGYLYTVTTEAGATAPTAAEVVASGESVSFRSDAISAQFSNSNSGAYDVHYVLTSYDGTKLSDVYTKSVEVVSITTTAEFEAMLASNDSTKIYLLANDLDYGTYTEGELTSCGTLTSSSTSFVGLFNGNGYTIKNANTAQAIFKTVKGGSIMNVKFENINITYTGNTSGSTSNTVGIIGTMYGGYVYNVAIKNISISCSAQRVGALIGQVTGTASNIPVTIENVSISNDSGYSITASQRVAGIIGYIQPTSGSDYVTVYVNNCYVNTNINAEQQIAGIVGAYCDYAGSYLSITNCYVSGTWSATGSASRMGAACGYQTQGAGTLVISRVIALQTMYYSGELVTTAQKNCSGIMGNYSSTADCTVTYCYAAFEEHNSDYAVTVYEAEDLTSETLWATYLGFDMENTWSYVTGTTTDEDGEEVETIVAPYITLNFITTSTETTED